MGIVYEEITSLHGRIDEFFSNFLRLNLYICAGQLHPFKLKQHNPAAYSYTHIFVT